MFSNPLDFYSHLTFWGMISCEDKNERVAEIMDRITVHCSHGSYF